MGLAEGLLAPVGDINDTPNFGYDTIGRATVLKLD